MTLKQCGVILLFSFCYLAERSQAMTPIMQSIQSAKPLQGEMVTDQQVPIHKLPPDLLQQICNWLTSDDLAAIVQTCWSFQRAIWRKGILNLQPRILNEKKTNLRIFLAKQIAQTQSLNRYSIPKLKI